MSDERDLAPVLEYLQGIGWDEAYVPKAARAHAPATRGPREQAERGRAPAPPRAGETSAPGARGVSGWAAVRATLHGAPEAAALPTSARPVSAPTSPSTSASIGAGAAPIVDDDPTARAAALAAVAAEALACTRCRLAGGRKTVVFGTGDPNEDLMFIGEGPGAEEDKQGLPFVGAAGQLLDRIIAAIGLVREQVYICNVVKCRPPGNRDPQPDEVAACRAFLESQVRLVRPRVIVALGRVAAQTLLGSDLSVGRLRGAWHEVLGVPMRVTYHPAALLRDNSYRRPTWEDMQLVRDRLTV